MKLKKLQFVLLILLPMLAFSCKTLTRQDPISEQPSQDQVSEENRAILEKVAQEDQQSAQQVQQTASQQKETKFVLVQNDQTTQATQESAKYDVSKVEVIGKIYFAFDSSEITDVANRNLESQLAWLQTNKNVKIKIEGHCDARGSKAYNYKLGKRRALAVKNYLVQNGIAASRIKAVTYGEDRPEVKGSGETIWSQNRRAVTITRIK